MHVRGAVELENGLSETQRDALRANRPHQLRRTPDVESDEVGRPVQVLIIGQRAVCFWADHAVREVKILDLKPAGP